MKPISYEVTISEDDKVIKIEDNGDLKAELSFALDKNTLFLNGKDGLEVAQIELPVAMKEITGQAYDPETKSIDLTIMQTNGEPITFSLDVAELVNVYTAGDGIDITDNIISLKIKDDSGTLTVDENGLDIDIDSLASSEDLENVKNSIKNIEEHIGAMEEGDNTIIEKIEDLNKVDESLSKEITDIKTAIGSLENIDSNITSEIDKLHAKDAEIEGKIGDLQIGDKSIADEIQMLKETDTSLENKIDSEIVDRQTQATDLETKLDGEIERSINKDEELGEKIFKLDTKTTQAANDLGTNLGILASNFQAEQIKRDGIDIKHDEEISSLQDTDESILAKIGTLEGSDTTIAMEIAGLHAKDAELSENVKLLSAETSKLNQVDENIFQLIGNIGAKDSEQDAEIKNLHDKDEEIISKLGNLEEIDTNITTEIAGLHAKDTEIENKIGALEEGDKSITEQINDLKNADSVIDRKTAENKQAILDLSQKVDSNDSSLREELNKEKTEREKGDAKNASDLRDEIKNREDADNALKTELSEGCETLIGTIELVKDKDNNLLYHLMVNGVNKGSVNIPKDKMLKSVEYNPDTKVLTFTWNESAQQEPTEINVSDLVDVYEAGDCITLDKSNGRNIFKIELDKSLYIKQNINGQLELALKVIKPENTSWKYILADKNNQDNGKIIDFTNDYNQLVSDVESKYETIEQHNNSLEKTKNDIIGKPSDAKESNTLFGVRAEIKDTESRIDGKIKTANDNTLEAAKNYANGQDTITLEAAKNYANAEVKKVNDKLDSNVKSLTQKDTELGTLIGKNATDIKQLSTGLGLPKYVGGDGIFDKLHKLVHDLSFDIDENNCVRTIKNLDDRITNVEVEVRKINGGSDIEGSISNLISKAVSEINKTVEKAKNDAINESKAYTDSKFSELVNSIEMTNNKFNGYFTKDEVTKEITGYTYSKQDIDNKDNANLNEAEARAIFQEKGNYALSSDLLKYATKNELTSALGGYVNKTELTTSLDSYYKKDTIDSKFETAKIASETMVNGKLIDYTPLDFAKNLQDLKLDKLEAEKTYAKKTEVITEIPSTYAKKTDLDAYAKKTDLSSVNDNLTLSIQTSTENALNSALEADKKYQLKGDYVETSTLTAKEKQYQESLNKQFADTVSSFDEKLKNYVTLENDYIDTKEIIEYGYLTSKDIEGYHFVNKSTFDSELSQCLKTQTAEERYASLAYVDNTFVKKDGGTPYYELKIKECSENGINIDKCATNATITVEKRSKLVGDADFTPWTTADLGVDYSIEIPVITKNETSISKLYEVKVTGKGDFKGQNLTCTLKQAAGPCTIIP